MSRRAFILGVLILPCLSAADLTFTGNLRFVSSTTINIRLFNGIVIDARLPKSGDLSSARIVGDYKFADQVQISCKGIHSVWDDSSKRYHMLELARIRLVRAGTPDETASTATSLSWQPGDNLLKAVPDPPKPPKPTDPEGLERIRAVNLPRARNMPNFVADEIAVRSMQRKGDLKWKKADTVESEIGFRGDTRTRDHIRINGKSFTTQSGWLPGVNWSSGFGEELRLLLDPDCINTFDPAGSDQLRGKRVTVYRFRIPMDGCFGPGTVGYRQYAGAQAGRMLADESTGDVLQLEFQEIGTPAELDGGTRQTFMWDFVQIGDASYLLPVASDFFWVAPNGDSWDVAVQFQQHRHFESSSTVTFHP